MDRLLGHLRQIRRRAPTNQAEEAEIGDLIEQVERLGVNAAGAHFRGVPGSWPDPDPEITNRTSPSAVSQGHTASSIYGPPETGQTLSAIYSIHGEPQGLSSEQRPLRRDSTENDATIAALLADDVSDDEFSLVEGSTQPRNGQTFDVDSELAANDRLATAVAIAIVESLDEVNQVMESLSRQNTINSNGMSWLEPMQELAATTAQSGPAQIECPICSFALDEDQEAEEDQDQGATNDPPARVFCPACFHPFHEGCLRRWLREAEAQPTCPHCRTNLDSEEHSGFMEEVRGS